MSIPDRQTLIANAVAFLADPKTQAAPLAKRIEFLEAKGLTQPEIEDAIRQAAISQSTLQSHSSASVPPYGSTIGYMAPYNQPPPIPRRDWRDYFIMAVVSGGIMYGVVALARKYLLPHLEPPSSSAYEADKDELSAQFDAAEALLKEIQEETRAAKEAIAQQKTRVDEAVDGVESVVKELREGEVKTRDEMREIRDEVDTIRDMLPKMFEKNKESQTQALGELQQELKSLKSLLLTRRPGDVAGAVTPPLVGRPSIPSWQLATPTTQPSSSNPVSGTDDEAISSSGS